MKSLWHKPGCKWVTSVGDPEKTPRDKDCPACQEEEAFPYQLSKREQLWEDQVSEMKKQIEKDPYQFLFGASNDRLRSIIPKSFLASSNFPWWEGDSSAKNNDAQMYKTVEINAESDVKPSSSFSRMQDFKKMMDAKKPSSLSANKAQTPSSGQPFTSGFNNRPDKVRDDLVFDPITMRMTPKIVNADTKASENLSTPRLYRSGKPKYALLEDMDEEEQICPDARFPDDGEPPIYTVSSTRTTSEETDSKFMRTKKALQQSWNKENAVKSRDRSEARSAFDAGKSSQRLDFAAYRAGAFAISEGSVLIRDKPLRNMVHHQLSQHRDIIRTFRQMRPKLVSESTTGASHLEDSDGTAEQASVAAGLDAFEQRAGQDHYSFTTGQDGLEAKLINSEISGNPTVAASIRMAEDSKPHSGAENTGYEDYEKAAGQGLYTFTTGQDNLESDLASSKISGNPQTAAAVNEAADMQTATDHVGYEEYEKQAGQGLYTFTTGQDNLESDIVTEKVSGNPTRAAGMKLLDDRTAHNEAERPSTSEIQADIAAFAADGPAETAAANHPDKSQPSTEEVRQNSPPSSTSSYQLLAYDTTSQSICSAVASSSFTPPVGETFLSIPEALGILEEPAKFLPHLSKHQENGYEIISASKNLLVLKQVRPDLAAKASLESPASSPKPEVSSTPITPDEAATDTQITDTGPSLKVKVTSGDEVTILLPQTGNFASPTGFVNHDRFYSEHITSAPEVKSSTRKRTIVRKEEPVFSGISLRARSGVNSSNHKSELPASHHGSKAELPNISSRTSSSQIHEHSPATSHLNSASSASFNGSSAPGNSSQSPRFRNAMLVAFWTAACCYATGVLVEYFRIGSQNGRQATSSGSSPLGLVAENKRWQKDHVKSPVVSTDSTSSWKITSTGSLIGGEVVPSWLWWFFFSSAMAYLCWR